MRNRSRRAFVLLVACAGVWLLAAPIAQAGSLPPLIAFDDDATGVYEFVPGATTATAARLVAKAGVFPQFSPSGSELAYTVEHVRYAGDPAPVNHLVVAARDGAHPRTLLSGPYTFIGNPASVMYGLAFSPDGKEIAYACAGDHGPTGDFGLFNGSEWAQLCVVDVATGAHHMVTDPASDDTPLLLAGPLQRLNWTRGGEVIASVLDQVPCPSNYAAGSRCGTSQLGAIDVHSGATTLLTSGPATAWAPALSPNGEELAFWQEGSDPNAQPYGVQISNLSGSAKHQVLDAAHIGPGTYSAAIFAPDSKHLLYTAYSSENEYDLNPFEVPASGAGTPHMLLDSNAEVYSPVWTGPLTTCTVPDLRGRTLAQAKTLLRRAACALGRVSGPSSHRLSRHVSSQSLRPHTNHVAGTKINVHVS